MAETTATEQPTREQLLALEPGDWIHFDGMKAYRPHPDPRNPLTERMLYFSRRYLEEKAVYYANRELVEDVLPDPWELICDMLERSAAERGYHDRDGKLVTVDD